MTTNKKYEFVPGDEKVIAPGRTVKRIRALVAISSAFVSPGALGGYVESETNLGVSGNAWVSGNAQVSGDAWVSDNAQVYGDAWVSGDALVSGNARVYDNARVSGDAQVYGNASILLVGPIGSRGATLTVHSDSKIGVRFSTGCFSGSRDEFFKAITETHGDNEHGNAYSIALMLADLMVKPCEVEIVKEAA